MAKMQKRGLVLFSVCTLVGTAMYLNWSYADSAEQVSQKILGESKLVNSDIQEAETESVTQLESLSQDYFAEARLSRQQARDTAIGLLEEASEHADQTAVNEAAKSIQTLAAYTIAESQIENLITAKGYQDCVAFMKSDGISVVVTSGAEGLQASDVAKITDVILQETDYNTAQIKILEAN